MLVYGDQEYQVDLNTLLAQTRDQLASVETFSALRELLIRIGQIEQAVYDEQPDLPERERFHEATILAAGAFYMAWNRQQPVYPHVLVMIHDLLYPVPTAVAVTVKVPESFAFYAVYPEQYILAAHHWLADHPEPGRALVVGIRSIGTTLGALVGVVLRDAGWEVQTLTVRPTGHAFDRQAALPPFEPTDWGLVVDEGPGQSGSSMAAVAQAMVTAGVGRECISFLPGHRNDPGSAASAETLAWWRTLPRYVADSEAVGVKERLAITTASFFPNATMPQFHIRPLYMVTPFDRLQYLCTYAEEQVIWKFAGLTGLAEQQYQQLQQRDRFTPPLLGVAEGFIALRHVEGKPLTRQNKNDDLLATLGEYIVLVQEPLTDQQGFDRLCQMLWRNVQIIFGDSVGLSIQHWSEQLPKAGFLYGYGDGNLAPEKWLRGLDGQLYKLDSSGRQWDHTLVRQQPVAWDVASAIIEWELDEDETEILLSHFHRYGGEAIAPQHLIFYTLAYAAFRCGMCHYSGQSYDFYREALMRYIQDIGV